MFLEDFGTITNSAELKHKSHVDDGDCSIEKLFKRVKELHLHSVQVINAERQQLALRLRHTCELARQFTFLSYPVFEVRLILGLAYVANDVDEAKMAALLNVDVFGITVLR